MNYNSLKEILHQSFLSVQPNYIDDLARSLFENPSKIKEIPEYFLYNRNFCFVVFDYKRYGFNYDYGKIQCTGIEFTFSKEGYDRLFVHVFVDYSTSRIYNSCLLIPIYKPEHFEGRKSISQIANKVYRDKDFERYLKRIIKRFNLNM